jgi:hypothetical protein
MPIHGYPGNVITANPTAPTSSVATGVWTTEQQLKAVAAGNWPFRIPTQQVSLSARFNSADTAYLSRTPASAGNRKTWTWSGWIKRSSASQTYEGVFQAGTAGSAQGLAIGDTSTASVITFYYTNNDLALRSTQVLRDFSAWYHLVVALDTTQATASNRLRIYLNGSEITTWTTDNRATAFSQNSDQSINNNIQHIIGNYSGSISSTYSLNGYLAEVYFIGGSALTPSSFGQTNVDTGVWEPIAYTGSYSGTNSFYLPFNFDAVSFSTDFLVVAGGGSGGGGANGAGGGGGGGGYRTSAGTSGGGGSAESALSLSTGTPYTITVGAGATVGALNTRGNNGSNSVFSTVTSTGGGAGGYDGSQPSVSGGSGGGSSGRAEGGAAGTANQGYQGGNGFDSSLFWTAGGGGGASAIGGSSSSGIAGNGGDGVASTITGSSVTRAGGGGGGTWRGDTSGGTGGSGGGGNGGKGSGSVGAAGSANTGSGGGGGGSDARGGAGGSGVVIIKIPDTRTATFSSGVTSSLSTAVSGFKIYTVTATSTTSETVTFT